MGSKLAIRETALPTSAKLMSVNAETFLQNVRGELADIAKGFFRLGYLFSDAKEKGYARDLGYNDVFELAEDIFRIKSSTVYNLMAVWEMCHEFQNPLIMQEEYREFGVSQLVEITRIAAYGILNVVSPVDSVRTVKAKVSIWNDYYRRYSSTPSLEYVEKELAARKAPKIPDSLENSAPELNGQLPGQTSLFVEGYLEEPQEQGLEEVENSRQSGKMEGETPISAFLKIPNSLENLDENPFEGLPAETEIYADKLVKDMKAQAVEVAPDEVFPSENQMRIHKGQAVSYIDLIERSENIEGVDHFFDMAIKRLVAMRACKLQALKGAKK